MGLAQGGGRQSAKAAAAAAAAYCNLITSRGEQHAFVLSSPGWALAFNA